MAAKRRAAPKKASRKKAAKKRAAKKKMRPPPSPKERLWPAMLGLTSLRVFLGAVWLSSTFDKLFWTLPEGGLLDHVAHFRDSTYPRLLQRGIDQPPTIFGEPFVGWSNFLESVCLPAASWLAPLILFFEILLGLSLVLGAFVRLTALLGALMAIAFAMTKNVWLLTVRDTNWMLVVAMLALSLMAAGRVWGLDARLRRRGVPGWIS